MKKQLLLAFISFFLGSTLLSNAQTFGCGQPFYDNGGANGNYNDSSNTTTTFCPNNPSETLYVNFGNISIIGNDTLFVYNESNGQSTLLMEITSGSPQQMTIESFTPGGCLTFVFISDATGNSSGWEAYVDCFSSPVCLPPSTITSTAINNTSSAIAWYDQNQSTGPWELVFSPALPSDPNPVIVNNQQSQYIATGLSTGIVYTVSIRTDCNGTFSSWSAPYTFSTSTATPCLVPTNVFVSDVTNTTTFVNWSSQTNMGGYEIIVLPCNSPTPTPNNSGTLVTTNSYLLTNLNAATCYSVYIRAICSSATTSAWSTPFYFTTLNATNPPLGCGSTFTDPGGPNANYANNSNATYTICPSNVGELVSVNFTDFGLESGFDFLKVYDGTSANAPLIANLTGSTIPQSVTATNPGGCLTFVFTSDTSSTSIGWIANVVCVPQGTCPRPVNCVATNITSNSAVIGWTEVGFASQWEVILLPCGSPAPLMTAIGTQTSTNPFSISGLNPNTCYTAYVRSICSPTETSTWSIAAVFTTLASPPPTPICGGTFTDPEGATANYANNIDSIVTICPIISSEKVTVTFTSFNTEATWDGLYVYDGNSIAATQLSSLNPAGNVPGSLPGAFWGATIPGPFTSSSADGCLTFRFRSDTTVTMDGWAADVTCSPPPTCPKPIALSLTSVVTTSATLGWTNTSTATSWEVFALPCGTPAPTANSTGIITSTNPYVFTGLTPGTCYTFYVRSLCSTTDISICSIGATATTTIAPPACGGLFIDNGGINANYLNNSDTTYTICPTNANDVVTVTFTSFDTEATWDGLYVFDGTSIASSQISSTNGAANVPGGMAGSFWGTTIPGPFTATDPSGCLTFRFRSDTTVTMTGWSANVTCGPDADKIILVAFNDQNNNGIKDSGENYFTNGSFVSQQNNSGSNTNAYSPTGHYAVYDANASNTYDFTYEIQTEYLPYYSSGLTSFNDINIPVGSGTQILYFPITLTQGYNDVTVSIIPLGAPRPGMTYLNKIEYKNQGVTASDGTITFVKPTLVSITNTSQIGTVTNPTGFTYAFTNLLPNETRVIYVSMSVPASPTVNLNDLLTANATISAPANDINLTNNSSTNSQIVVNSYDPNDKMESHGDKIPFNQFAQDDYLYYTVRFQNNGTANAIDVKIEDILDSQIDEESIRMISSSHDYVMTRVNNNLVWEFKNIQLVPSSLSESLSSGYVFFKVKLIPGFQTGDIIPNTASIYFDTNPAIVTNTFNTKFTAALSNLNFTANDFTLYPNPANQLIHINSSSETISKISFYDVLGKNIKEVELSPSNTISVDVSSFPKGVYLVEITTENGYKQIKKLVVK